MRAPAIDPRPTSVLMDASLQRPEGLAFSPDGQLIAVACSEANGVLLYERKGATGEYGSAPVATLAGAASGIAYPHDVDFSPDGRVLAVASREGPSLGFFVREPASRGGVDFGTRPRWMVRGRRSGLAFTEGVKFVPPDGAYVAAVNHSRSSATFYRRLRGWPGRPLRFSQRPCFLLGGPETGIIHPDGLAFAPDGSLLAVTNHTVHSVTFYARGPRAPEYGPEPIAEIRGEASGLRYPHSLAFSPDAGLLAVSNAGGRRVAVFRRLGARAWEQRPALELDACDPERFDAINAENVQEGGSKGLAFGGDCLAFCSASLGLRVHRVLA